MDASYDDCKKLGVILPVSREYLNYKLSDFFEEMQPKIAEAFYKKFDAAALLNKENPFPQSLDGSVISAGMWLKADWLMIIS